MSQIELMKLTEDPAPNFEDILCGHIWTFDFGKVILCTKYKHWWLLYQSSGKTVFSSIYGSASSSGSTEGAGLKDQLHPYACCSRKLHLELTPISPVFQLVSLLFSLLGSLNFLSK